MTRRVCDLLCALFLLLAAFGATAQDTDADGLWNALAAQETAAGSFRQAVYDERGELLERSSGRYAILRPRFFRWEIDDPDRQLLLVANDALWHYDIDLATATRRDSAGDSAFAPLELLGGDIAEMRARFAVQVLAADRYRLLPRWPQAGFASVDLSWSDEQLTAMTVIDRGGQRLEIALDPELPPPALRAEDFSFEPPPGVDVFVDGE